MFSINKNKYRNIRKSKNSNMKPSISHRIPSNYNYVNDLLIIMNIKQEVLMLLNHYTKMH